MKLSVITATYNCADTLADCLDSVAQQTHPEVEHILIDAASSDGTLALLQARRDQLAQLVSEPDGGLYFGLNKGIALASGEVLGFLHGDDVYADTEVLAQVAAAFADPTVAAVYGGLEYVSQTDPTRVVRHWRAGAYQPQRLRWGWMPPHPTLEAVFNKLDQPLPLGYCNVGRVISAQGAGGGFQDGDRVVSNGTHAEVVSVPLNLCAKVPDAVSDEESGYPALTRPAGVPPFVEPLLTGIGGHDGPYLCRYSVV